MGRVYRNRHDASEKSQVNIGQSKDVSVRRTLLIALVSRSEVHAMRTLSLRIP
jgi:hypothetical protein